MAGRRVVVRELSETPEEGIERCSLEDQPEVDVGSLAADDVVIAVRAAAVGWVDVIMTSGQYQHVPKLPYTPGLEYAGIVTHVGSTVTNVRPGDAVIADGLRTGPRSKGKYQQQGGFATWATATADAVLPLPAGLSFAQGASLLGNYETAWHVLATCGRVQSGETVLIHGATGGTGLAAVHVAKHLGATVIATGRSADKLAIVKAQGADHVVIPEVIDGEPRFRDAVKTLTGGKGADVVYDGVGGPISIESLRCVKFGARFLVVGWASTPLVSRGKGLRGAPNANQLPTNLILMKGLHVIGCPAVIATEHDPSIRPPRLAAVLDLVANGVRPVVAKSYELADFRAAMHAKRESREVGAIVLVP